ncbi:MAG: hypothetical protein ACTSQF_08120 [Candidatus Heimdallarchaeaceae archaeon]
MSDSKDIKCLNCGEEFTVWDFTGNAAPPERCKECGSTNISIITEDDETHDKKQEQEEKQDYSTGRFGIGPEISIECFDCNQEFGGFRIGFSSSEHPSLCPNCEGENISVKVDGLARSDNPDGLTTKPEGYFGAMGAAILAIHLATLMEIDEDIHSEEFKEKRSRETGKDEMFIDEYLDPFLPMKLRDLVMSLGSKGVRARSSVMDDLMEHIGDVIVQASESKQQLTEDDYKKKYAIYEKFIPVLEERIFDILSSIEDFQKENIATYNEFMGFLNLLQALASSHARGKNFSEFTVNTYPEKYQETKDKLKTWLSKESNQQIRKMVQNYITVIEHT